LPRIFEFEFKVRRDVKPPAGKILIPGAVSHATDLVEHPELVADRIITFAEIVGQENVIAGTHCGLGGRVHRQFAWARLRAFATARQSRARSCGVECKSAVPDERNKKQESLEVKFDLEAYRDPCDGKENSRDNRQQRTAQA
jgi:hypothetical protein